MKAAEREKLRKKEQEIEDQRNELKDKREEKIEGKLKMVDV